MLGQGARRALFYNPRLAHEERGAFRERRRLGGVFRRGAVVARGRRLREREELAPLDALRHLDLDAVGAGHDRARRARRHDPGDRLLRPVLRGVDGRGRPLDQASPQGVPPAAAVAREAAAAAREAGPEGPRDGAGAGQELFLKRRDAGRELLQNWRDAASEPGAPLGELLVARADLSPKNVEQPAEEQADKEQQDAQLVSVDPVFVYVVKNPEPGERRREREGNDRDAKQRGPAQLLAARAHLVAEDEEVPAEEQGDEQQEGTQLVYYPEAGERRRDHDGNDRDAEQRGPAQREFHVREDPAPAAPEDAAPGAAPLALVGPVAQLLEPRVADARRLRDAARRRDADDVDDEEAQPREDVEHGNPQSVLIPGELRAKGADVRNRLAAAPVGPLLHRGPELLEEDGVVAELAARLPAGPEAAAVELFFHVPRARVGRGGRRFRVEPGEMAGRARRDPEVRPRVVEPPMFPMFMVVGAVPVPPPCPRLVPPLPLPELRVEEVAVFGDHAAGPDALSLAHAPVPRAVWPRRPRDVAPPPVALTIVPRPPTVPGTQVPPAPRIRAGVVERAGRRVAAQVVAGVGLAPEAAGAVPSCCGISHSVRTLPGPKVLQEDIAPPRTGAVEAVGHRRDALRVVGTLVRAAGADAADIIHARQRVVVGAVPRRGRRARPFPPLGHIPNLMGPGEAHVLVTHFYPVV